MGIGYQEKSGIEPVTIGEYKATITNAWLHGSSYQNGPVRARILLECTLKDVTLEDGSPRELWHFISAGYNPKSTKHTGTIFWNAFFGRPLTEAEANALEYDHLIGVGAVIGVGVKNKADGTPVNTIMQWKVKKPASVTVESLKANWEASGSKQGYRPERAGADYLDIDPGTAGATAAATEEEDF